MADNGMSVGSSEKKIKTVTFAEDIETCKT